MAPNAKKFRLEKALVETAQQSWFSETIERGMRESEC
jgi:hypothetical protein